MTGTLTALLARDLKLAAREGGALGTALGFYLIVVTMLPLGLGPDLKLLSKIASDGYIDRAASNLRSFYVSGGYYSAKSFVRLNVFSGQEKTYQAWNGVPEDILATNRRYNEFTYPNQTDNYQQDQYQLITSTELSRSQSVPNR